MKKNKLSAFLIITLVCTNLILVFILFSRGHPPEPKKHIIKTLNFDKEQVLKYENLIKEHRHKISSLDQKIKDLKVNLYNSLSKTENSVLPDSLSSEIAVLQKEIELTHYNHFKDIQKICRKDQLPSFNALSKDFAKLFSRKGPKK